MVVFTEPIGFGLVGHCHEEIVGVLFELDLFVEFDLVFDVVVHLEGILAHDIGDAEAKDESVKWGFGFHLGDVLFELVEGRLTPAIMDEEWVFCRGWECDEGEECGGEERAEHRVRARRLC